jgi:hypothetical protein
VPGASPPFLAHELARWAGFEATRAWESYLIKNPIIALFPEDGRHVARTIPSGSFITVDSAAFDSGDGLVDVTSYGRRVMMFTEDLLSRAELVPEKLTGLTNKL